MRSVRRQTVDVAIAIPVRNEQDSMTRCLTSVLAAVRHACDDGHIGSAALTVVAHQCSDDSAQVARRLLRRHSGADVLTVDRSASVGEIRHLAVRRGLAHLASAPTGTWVLSTDADTSVPRDWISRILVEARLFDAACVVGLAALDGWHGEHGARQRYEEIMEAKMYSDDEHGHVYGANLAVRADAYLSVGGFPRAGHGEDQRLVDTLVRDGYAVRRTRHSTVSTSARLQGRAAGGLAELLRDLDVRGAEVVAAAD